MLISRAHRGRGRVAPVLSGAAATATAVVMVMATASSPVGAVPGGTPGGAMPAQAAPSAGCGQTPTLASGTHSISSGGTNRSFILEVPDNYDSSRPYRLVFGFHWLGGSAQDVATGSMVPGGSWAYYGLLARSQDSTIFVAPQGINNGWWNTNGEDLAFTDAMLALLQSGLCIDTEQIFSLGFSFGGGMSYALACARPEVFRAVAVYAGGVISGCQGGTEPVAYLGAHGLTDNVLPIAGARTMRDRFVANNGCTAATAPEPAQGSGTHTSFTYAGCAEGYPVAWYAFDGGHTPVPPDNGATWLPDVTWEFFTQFETIPAAA